MAGLSEALMHRGDHSRCMRRPTEAYKPQFRRDSEDVAVERCFPQLYHNRPADVFEQ